MTCNKSDLQSDIWPPCDGAMPHASTVNTSTSYCSFKTQLRISNYKWTLIIHALSRWLSLECHVLHRPLYVNSTATYMLYQLYVNNDGGLGGMKAVCVLWNYCTYDLILLNLWYVVIQDHTVYPFIGLVGYFFNVIVLLVSEHLLFMRS